MTSLYEHIGGSDVVLAIAHHWHARVLADPVVSHAFDGGVRADHTERLAAYWSEVLGGPTAYTGAGLGDESHVVRLHSGNGEHDEMDRRAVQAFADALVDAGVPVGHHDRLVAWFDEANQVINHRYRRVADVPDGLPMPQLVTPAVPRAPMTDLGSPG